MEVGLTGKSNTGKSTFFKAATMVDVEISNRIFTTIEPTKGVTYVTVDCPCVDLDVSCDPENSKCRDGTRLVPVNILDVAGLVPGAHKGKGLGNQFLSDLMKAKGLIHIIDISGRTDDQGNPTKGHDPEKDIVFLEEEIDRWIEGLLEEKWSSWKQQVNRDGEEMYKLIHNKLTGLGVTEIQVKTAFKEGYSSLKDLASKIREKSKPIILAGNKVDVKEGKKNYRDLQEGYELIPVCAEGELALREADKNNLIDYIPGSSSFEIKEDLNQKKRKALNFIKREVLDEYGSTGVQRCLNKLVFDELGYIVVYPVESKSKYTNSKGKVLPDAYLIKKGSNALELAYKIHSDIGNSFKGAINARTGEKLGKSSELVDGDIIEILN